MTSHNLNIDPREGGRREGIEIFKINVMQKTVSFVINYIYNKKLHHTPFCLKVAIFCFTFVLKDFSFLSCFRAISMGWEVRVG